MSADARLRSQCLPWNRIRAGRSSYLLSSAGLLLTGAALALGDGFGRRRMCPLVTAACG